MKKSYIQPMTFVVSVHGETPLAQSLEVSSTNKVSNSQDIGFVKGESSRTNHSVWDDDWSKE